MKKIKIVTVGNLARNAKFFTEVLNEKYEITNILINEKPIQIAKDIVISRTDNPFLIFLNIVKAYYYLFKSDLIISFTASLSSVLFRFFFVKIKSKKYIAYATGSDLREAIYYPKNGEIVSKFFKKADIVVFHNNDENTLNSIKHLDLQQLYWHNMYKQTEFNESLIDTSYINNSELCKSVLDFIDGSFAIFMPSFIDYKSEQTQDKYFCSKGNDLAYDALIRFVEKHPSTKIVLRGVGIDTEHAKETLNIIKDNVMYVQSLSKKDFINLMSIFDIILDSFKQGAFGGVALEAASIGMPLLTNPPRLDYYPDDKYPFLQNRNSSEIYENLVLLHDDIGFRMKYANLCKDWVIRNHSSNEYVKLGKVIDNYILEGRFEDEKPNNGGFFGDSLKIQKHE